METKLELELRLLLDPRITSPKFKNSRSILETIDIFKFLIPEIIRNGNILFNGNKAPPRITATHIIKLAGTQIEQHENNELMCYVKKKIDYHFTSINFKQDYKSVELPIKVALASETPEKCINETPSRARIMNRISIFLGCNWRIDFSAVKTVILGGKTNLKKSKIKAEYSNLPAKFISRINNVSNLLKKELASVTELQRGKFACDLTVADSLELEVEYIGDLFDKSIRDSKNAAHIAEVDKVLKWISQILTRSEALRHTSQTKIGGGIVSQNMHNDGEMKWVINKLAHMLRSRGVPTFKNITNNPITLDRSAFISINMSEFYITNKADGDRCLLLFNAFGKNKYITSSIINNLDTRNVPPHSYVIDAEKIGDKFYMFDIIMNEGRPVGNEPFSSRLQYLQEFAKQNRNPTYSLKIFAKLGNKYWDDIKSYSKNKFPYDTDGFIITSANASYFKKRNYKWKPPEFNTIDFVCMLDSAPKSKSKETNYILFCGINEQSYRRMNIPMLPKYKDMFSDILQFHNDIIIQDYFPIHFSPSLNACAYKFTSKDAHLNGKVLELGWDDGWVLHRIRHDRQAALLDGSYYGNNFRIAEITWQSIHNPLTFADLTMPQDTFVKDVYFNHQDNKFNAVKIYNKLVKASVTKEYVSSGIILDLASGRGADMPLYFDINPKILVMTDIDRNALDTLIQRKYKHYHRSDKLTYGKIDPKSQPSKNLRLYIEHANLNDKWQDNVLKIDRCKPTLKGKVNHIICHFALHYMLSKSSDNIVALINYYLAPGGIFIFTAFGEKEINNLLKNKSKWKTDKYLIEKKKGREISVLIPCSREVYSENVINEKSLDNVLAEKGIKKINSGNFGERNNIDIVQKFKQLSVEDSKFVSLYKYHVYRRL